MQLDIQTAGEAGNGKADLVLLHGWGLHAGVWDEVVAKLAPAFCVHRVNLPGYGDSKYEPCTPERIVDALAEALPERVIVCGWSLGGQIALRWALRFPAQLEKLILISTTPCYVQRAGHENAWQHGMNAGVFGLFAGAMKKGAAPVLQRFAGLLAHGDRNARVVMHTVKAAITRMPTHDALIDGLAWLEQTDLRDDIANIKTPALVMHGADDVVTPALAGEWLAKHLPNAQWELWPDTAHAPFLSNPEKFVQRVMEFCHE